MSDDFHGLLVAKNPCEHCLFSKHPIVSAASRKQVLAECKHTDSHFLCHVPQVQQTNEEVVCKGFYDNCTSQMIRIAQRLHMVFFVDVEAHS